MAKKLTKPAVPAYQPVSLPAYQPVDYAGAAATALPIQKQYANENLKAQTKAQSTLTRNQAELTKEIAPEMAALRVGTNAEYSPQITQQYLDLINQADPEFLSVRKKLGTQVSKGLDDGYSLGDDLAREVEQATRKGQTARGNWLGPAPTAAEAFAKASAGIDLYNQRQGAATSFLQSRAPSDLFSSYGITEAYQPVNVITPSSGGIDAGLPFSLATAEAGNQNTYTGQTLQAYGMNTQAADLNYSRNWDRYLYNTAVQQGLYAPIGAGGGGFNGQGAMTGALGGAASGAMAGAAMGAMAGGVGAVPGAVIGGAAGAILGGTGGGLMS